MSTSQKSSRWGSFLSQAVAGVEARLDNILAEDDGTKGSTTAAVAPNPSPAAPTPPARSATPSRSANDRLQERLARAVASKNAASSARQSLDAASPASSPRPSSDTPRVPPASIPQVASPRTSLTVEETAVHVPHTSVDSSGIVSTPATDEQSPAIPIIEPSSQFEAVEPRVEDTPESAPISEAPPTTDDAAALSLYKERITHLEETLEELKAQNQEEIHSYTERVDALQTKLQYIAREASENARNAARNAPAGSSEKKMAEKDDQIAQLMLEGQKLAATELTHRTIIKRLKAQVAGNEKEISEQKAWRQKAEKELADIRRRIDESNDREKANQETLGLLRQARREIDKLKVENETKDQSIADLKNQLQEESEIAKSLAARADDDQREAGQKRVKELEDAVATLEVEKSLAVDRAKIQVAEARERAERASERARAIELELKGEVQILESKLEALRIRAEEASSGAVGDAQVKLLRQIETLQTQYSVASENWQSMEASLAAKVANLEKERDEALRRESEMRRKAREVVSFSANYLRSHNRQELTHY